jgi:hypothetical protein
LKTVMAKEAVGTEIRASQTGDAPLILNNMGPVITLEVRPRRRVPVGWVVVVSLLGVLSAGVWFRVWWEPSKAETAAEVVATSTTANTGGTVASASRIAATSAVVTWTTSQPMTSQVEYGMSTTHELLSAFSPAPVTSHSVMLTGLKPGTSYNCAAISTSPDGQTVKSPNMVFSTSDGTGNPAVSRINITDITSNSALVTWTTDQPAASQVEYGATTAYGLLSEFHSGLTTDHSVKLTGLTPLTTYDVGALSTNSSGLVGASANVIFATTGPAGAPAVSLVIANDVTTSSARISWDSDQAATSQVEYGPTLTYGSLSAFIASPVTSHSMLVTGLTPGTTYEYSALSANTAGQVGRSTNHAFTTIAAPPVIRTIETRGLTGTSVTITWTTDQPSTSEVAYGATTAYGSLSAPSSALVTSHSVTLHGLSPGTNYDLAIRSTNSQGMANSSPNVKVVTPARGGNF